MKPPLLRKKSSDTSIQSTESQTERIRRRQGEVMKAKANLSIAIAFIACHSLKWILNIMEIKLVRYY